MKNLKIFSLLILFALLFQSCERDLDPVLDTNQALEILDFSYGADARQKMDVYLPAGRSRANTKVLVWVHGGSWMDGSKDEFSSFKPWFEAAQEDYAYVALNYRLFDLGTGANRFPSQEEDIQSALDLIRSKLSEWNVSDQLVLAGASAGGHLSLLHAYKNNSNGLVKVAVALFPPTDLLGMLTSNALAPLLFQALVGSPQEDRQKYLDSSPLNFVNSESVPTAFFHGTADTVVPVQQSRDLEEALKENGVPFLSRYYEGKGHGFSEQTYRDLLIEVEGFIQENMP
ncbi:alpha/beta hydrolase [Arthrospiribacter ruber]|uniref:Alpha/beta hydrolase n=1 Tax=Arthrospiribacter ruber TaxID=2487934 RepID=A0A951MDV9_9BACT|nr:alpha/beta hydrolase [Arthrospiribacter ruber]MBW3467541.1 alpha/beta hydrolase [Arthrospiribacter ruber]